MRYAKDPESANDIFQDGFYLVYKNIGQLKNAEALSGWIQSIFVNTAIEYCKKAKRIFPQAEMEPYVRDAAVNWNNAVSNLGTEEITKLIQELPPGCQTVFNMYAIDGYSHKEIAEQMGISIGTSKSQLHDARKILKQKIAEVSMIKRSVPDQSE